MLLTSISNNILNYGSSISATIVFVYALNALIRFQNFNVIEMKLLSLKQQVVTYFILLITVLIISVTAIYYGITQDSLYNKIMGIIMLISISAYVIISAIFEKNVLFDMHGVTYKLDHKFNKHLYAYHKVGSSFEETSFMESSEIFKQKFRAVNNKKLREIETNIKKSL